MLKIVKDSVLKVSRSFGYDIVPLREMKERDFALHLRELLARLEIDCVLDVGANAGQYHDFLRERVQYDGTIVSFEPLSRHVEALRERSRGDGNWHIEGYALGSSEGSLQINVMVSDQFSSFLEPDHDRVERLCRPQCRRPYRDRGGAHPRWRAARLAGAHRLQAALPQDRHPGLRHRGPARCRPTACRR